MPRSKLITLKFTCPCLPLVTLEIKKIFVHLCYEGVCDEGIDPIDFCDLYLISNEISQKELKDFIHISFQDHFYSYLVPKL